MATKQPRSAARLMMAPAVILLLGWMLVPLTMTLYFSFKKFLPLRGDSLENGLQWVGFQNYVRFVSSSSFWPSVQTTLIIVGGVLIITVALGILLASIVIDMIAFPKDAKPGEVAPEIIHELGMIDSPYLIIPGLIAAAFYAGYRLNRRRHAEISQELGHSARV